MKVPARDFHTGATVGVPIVRVVPVEPDLTIAGVPIAVRDVAVGKTHRVSAALRQRHQKSGISYDLRLPELSRGLSCIV